MKEKEVFVPEIEVQEHPDYTVTFWTVQCNDCEFISGLAEIKFVNGQGTLISGAGCWRRRDLKEVRRSIQKIIGDYYGN